MEPGRHNWMPTTVVLVPLWDVTVGKLRLFSRITEILAEIERNWKCGWWILSRVTHAQRTNAHANTHTQRERELHKQMQKCIFLKHILSTLMHAWMKTPALSVQISVRDRLGNCSLFLQHDCSYKFKTALVHTAAVSSVLDIYLHNIKCCGLFFSFLFFRLCLQAKFCRTMIWIVLKWDEKKNLN